MALALRFADGSVASIAYGSTPPVAGKERIEVLAGSHQVIIDDFRSVLVDGTVRAGRAARTRATAPTPPRSARRCRAARDMPTEAMLGAMRATIQAADRAREPYAAGGQP